MQTFARLLSFVTFLLSVGFIAQALPTAPTGNGIAVRDYNTPAGYDGGHGYNGGSGYTPSPVYSKDSYSNEAAPANKEGDHDPSSKLDLLALATKLHTDMEPLCKDLEAAADINAATHTVDKILIVIQAVIASCVDLKLNLDIDTKTKIAVEIMACITLIVKALAAVCVKLGVNVCLALIAKIDMCLQLLLITLNLCVDGLLVIIIPLCAKFDVSVLAALKLCNLELLIKICGLVKLVAEVTL
ncbi:unnamed protein product [Rhizoctonia solani]|uniref:Transmembrane protein n=1 Tax=Rhizoctonia solani TaxID=456999 RepID=A0A8H2XV41_9AGAM|nr:unnamed protein product [Rhizoctonia solani]